MKVGAAINCWLRTDSYDQLKKKKKKRKEKKEKKKKIAARTCCDSGSVKTLLEKSIVLLNGFQMNIKEKEPGSVLAIDSVHSIEYQGFGADCASYEECRNKDMREG